MATFMLFFRLDTKKLQIVVVMFYLFVFCVNCQFGAVLLVVNGNFNPKNTTATMAWFKQNHFAPSVFQPQSLSKRFFSFLRFWPLSVELLIFIWRSVMGWVWVDSIGMWREKMGFSGAFPAGIIGGKATGPFTRGFFFDQDWRTPPGN